MKIIEEQWKSFEANVVPKDAGTSQREAMQIAFYAGAHSLLKKLLLNLTPGPEPRPEDVSMLDSIAIELLEFTHRLRS